MLEIGDIVVCNSDLPREDGLIFLNGHKFKVTDITIASGRTLYDIQDDNYSTLYFVDSRFLELDEILKVGAT